MMGGPGLDLMNSWWDQGEVDDNIMSNYDSDSIHR